MPIRFTCKISEYPNFGLGSMKYMQSISTLKLRYPENDKYADKFYDLREKAQEAKVEIQEKQTSKSLLINVYKIGKNTRMEAIF